MEPATEPAAQLADADAAAEAATPAHTPRVNGEPFTEIPEELYIPPDALEVFLDAFEGPLDLLLYLIRKQNLNILDIPVFKITQQYLQYIDLMQQMRFELAAEYMVMAAWLAEIKSRMLLPKPPASEDEEVADPRSELVRRLQEYERFKTAAENIEALPREGREFFVASSRPDAIPEAPPPPPPSLRDLLMAFHGMMRRADLFTNHQVAREALTVRERMTRILGQVQEGPRNLQQLVDPEEGRLGIVVCLLAILELVKLAMVDLVQEGPFADILIDVGRPDRRAVSAEEGA